jgi:outer membrane protein
MIHETRLVSLGEGVDCGPMMRTFPWVVALVSVVATQAGAQSFSNRSLGLGLGYISIVSDVEPIKYAVPVVLEGGYYIDAGFETYLRVPLMLAYSAVGVGPAGEGGLVVGTGGQLGIRYLFLEESIRPYVGAHLSGLYFFRDSALGPNFQFGPGVTGGVEFFVGESISVGGRGFFDLFITLNAPVRFAVGGGVSVSTYF